VRVLRGPNAGWVGTIATIYPRAQRIETGSRVHGAEVRFGTVSSAFVPFANLELLR
jgi:hypothetical protein